MKEPLEKIYRRELAEKVNKVYNVGESDSRDLRRVFVRFNLLKSDQGQPSLHSAFLGLMDTELRRRRNPLVFKDEGQRSFESKEAGDQIKRTIDPDELVRERTHVVITGAPGCGKTTLLRYLTLKTLEDQRFAVFLELKSVNEADFQQVGNNLAELLFDKAIASVLHLHGPERDIFKGFFFSRLKVGETVIFLDGLDEVSGTHFFPALCNAVREFVHSDFRRNGLVISTRPYAFQRIEGMKEMEIAPLTSQQVEEFLKYYYGDDAATRQLLQHLRRHRSEERRVGKEC